MKIWKEQLLGKFHEISAYPLSSQLDRRVDMSTCPLVPPIPEG